MNELSKISTSLSSIFNPHKIFTTSASSPHHIQNIKTKRRPSSIINMKTEDLGIANATWKNTTPFIPPVTSGKVVKVYDGDTITIATRLPFINDDTIYRFSVRLNGIDTPEIKTDNPLEKKRAIQIRELMHSKLMGKIVQLENVSIEKYGRLLATVILDNQNINEWLLSEGFAVKYNGGTKPLFPPFES